MMHIRARRPRRLSAALSAVFWTLTALTLACTTVLGPAISPSSGARAAAAPSASTQSMFTKTGTDERSGATATAGQSPDAKAGDTVDWTLNYDNTSGSPADVSITDPIRGQQYVPSSLVTPPNFSGSVDADTLHVTGQVPAQTTATVSGPFATSPLTYNTPGGDGYTVEGWGANVYTVFHHNGTTKVVFCSTLTNGYCPGWGSTHASYVALATGTPIGTGPVPDDVTADQNGSFIVDGKLYWPVEFRSLDAATNSYPVGVQCLDLASVTSCGFTRLDGVPDPPINSGGLSQLYPYIEGDGIQARDGHYYFFDENGSLACFDPGSGPCGLVNLSGQLPVQPTAVVGLLGTYGGYVFVAYVTVTGTGARMVLTCFDTVGGPCAGFPRVVGAARGGNPSEVLPVVSLSGSGVPTVLGACVVYDSACFTAAGNPIANPYPTSSVGGFAGLGSGVLQGSKYYTILNGRAGASATAACYDFALPLQAGKVQPCAGYIAPSSPYGYTVRALPNLPGCMASDGDHGQIVIFDGATGGGCPYFASQTVSLTPAQSYCDGKSGHATTWDALTLLGLTGSEYDSATLTLRDVNGTVVPGFDAKPIPAGTPPTLSLRSIPVSGATASLTAQVHLSGVRDPGKVSAARLELSWLGDPVQICFKTVLPTPPCPSAAPVVVSNTATAVTTVNGVSDGGNAAGPVSFRLVSDSHDCLLRFAKTADVSHAQSGDVVTYTITVTNAGAQPFQGPSFTDDLSRVLDDATLLRPDPGITVTPAGDGTAGYDATNKTLSWSWPGGSLPPNAQVSVSYQVRVGSSAAGDHLMVNTVVSPNPSNCQQGTTVAAECTVTVPIGVLTVVKTSTPASGSAVSAGERVSYTLTFRNTGNGPVQVAYTDNLTQVLNNATSDGAPVVDVTSGSTLDARLDTTAELITVSGSIAARGQATVTYSVTVKPDNERASDVLTNYVYPFGTTPPTACPPNTPTCTTNPIPRIVVAKSVDPSSGTVVHGGDVLTYTLTFANVGQGSAHVDYTDLLGDVLDDAALTSGPTVTAGSPLLSATFDGAATIHVVGDIMPKQTGTVTYTVTVKAAGVRHNDRLANFLMPTDTPPPASCAATDPRCTVNPVGHLTVTKSDSASTPPVPGDVVTYTVRVVNDGQVDYTAADPASVVDDLSAVLDDATYNDGSAASVNSDPAAGPGTVTVDQRAARLTWTGALPVGASVTITYSVTYHATGDTRLVNTACVPLQGTDPNCDRVDVPGSLLQVSKSVDPRSGTSVHPHEALTYTLTFRNAGKGSARVDYLDDLHDVLDDATVIDGPHASDPALTVGYDASAKTIAVVGSVPGETTYTVLYRVRVKDEGSLGNRAVTNYLFANPPGRPGRPPSQCASGDPLCTTNPVPPEHGLEAVTTHRGPLAWTGADVRGPIVLGATLLGLGALVMLGGRRRTRVMTVLRGRHRRTG